MKDPTETAAIRTAWGRQLKRRYRSLRGRVNQLFTQGKVPFDAAFVEFFDAWFTAESAKLFAGDWQDKYIRDAYAKGLLMSGINTGIDAIHTDSIKTLSKRAKSDLAAALVVMRAQSLERISDGILAAASKRDMAESVKDRINKIGQSRSILIANTITPYAHNVAAIKAATIAGGDIKMLWITRQDERVRTTHALRNRRTYSLKVAMNLLGEPGCRCRVKPVLVDEKAAKGYKEIRTEGLAVSIQAQKDRKFYATLREGERAEGYSGGYDGLF